MTTLNEIINEDMVYVKLETSPAWDARYHGIRDRNGMPIGCLFQSRDSAFVEARRHGLIPMSVH